LGSGTGGLFGCLLRGLRKTSLLYRFPNHFAPRHDTEVGGVPSAVAIAARGAIPFILTGGNKSGSTSGLQAKLGTTPDKHVLLMNAFDNGG
jgi:hypothetical protein